MQVVICNTFHKSQIKQANLVNTYYRSLGYKVDSFPADFLEVSEADCRNEFFKRNPYDDYVIFFDSDEIVLPGDLQLLIALIDRTKKDVYRCSVIDYVAPDRVLKEQRAHMPVIAVINRVKYNKAVKFKYNRNVTKCDSVEEVPISIHHLGYLLNPAWKIKNYSERKEYHELGNVESISNQEGVIYPTPKEVQQIIGGLATY